VDYKGHLIDEAAALTVLGRVYERLRTDKNALEQVLTRAGRLRPFRHSMARADVSVKETVIGWSLLGCDKKLGQK
jgi:hypothetical protein